jgi:acyl-CoA reductase-like NAD-dependent aldehyde dehydrogenase
VVNIVPGDWEIGAYLVKNPGINKVTFTGSNAADRWIAEACRTQTGTIGINSARRPRPPTAAPTRSLLADVRE